MNIFLDTEFIENGPGWPIELLSIALVDEDGREFYAINNQADIANASLWVQTNVLPTILAGWHEYGKMRETIRDQIVQFVGPTKPTFIGYYADYDWVVFCQIFGTMMDLPNGWPLYCRDLKQMLDWMGNARVPFRPEQEHHALSDARWNKAVYEWIAQRSHLLGTMAARF